MLQADEWAAEGAAQRGRKLPDAGLEHGQEHAAHPCAAHAGSTQASAAAPVMHALFLPTSLPPALALYALDVFLSMPCHTITQACCSCSHCGRAMHVTQPAHTPCLCSLLRALHNTRAAWHDVRRYERLDVHRNVVSSCPTWRTMTSCRLILSCPLTLAAALTMLRARCAGAVLSHEAHVVDGGVRGDVQVHFARGRRR